jgi:hypothetical protein
LSSIIGVAIGFHIAAASRFAILIATPIPIGLARAVLMILD